MFGLILFLLNCQKTRDRAPVGAKHLGDYPLISTKILLPNGSPSLAQRDAIAPLEKPGFFSKPQLSDKSLRETRFLIAQLDFVQDNANTIIKLKNGKHIGTLVNVNASQLSADNFLSV